ncbi:MAG: hypothetical protein IKP23_03830 [Elusimicrobiaceae bacterium]|nr:hypothetical protein [Elusimicrobiaceae bacterium]
MEDINNVINMPEENKQEFFVGDGVRNDSFIKESNGKIGVLSFLFSIFYPIGYFYKQWKAIKKNNEEYKNISPFWRGVFYPFYAFKFTKILDNLLTIKKNMDFSGATNEEEKKKLENEYAVFNKFYSNSYMIALVPIVTVALIFCTFIPESFNTGIGAAVWVTIYMTLRNLQKAIDKILPQDHPKGKLTFSDFLGFLILIIFLISMLFIFPLFNDPWIEIKGNTLTDTDAKYSITFPFENQKIVRIGIGITSYCQKKPGTESDASVICLQSVDFSASSFERDVIAKELEEADNTKILSSKTALYNDNLGYCFSVENASNICFMQLKDNPKMAISVISNFNEEVPFENLEKMLNSYKKL